MAPHVAWAVAWTTFRRGPDLAFEMLVIYSASLALGMFLFLATGIASYWFHPRAIPVARQNCSIALSYYACAPLAWLWLPAAILIPATNADRFPPFLQSTGRGLFLVSGILAAVLVLHWIVINIVFMYVATRGNALRTFAFALALPALWMICVCVSAAVPAAAFYVALVVHSLR